MIQKYPEPGRMQYISAGMEFFFVIAVFTAVGAVVDMHLDSLPAFMLTGLVVGFAAALWRLVRAVKPLVRKNDPPNDEQKSAPQ